MQSEDRAHLGEALFLARHAKASGFSSVRVDVDMAIMALEQGLRPRAESDEAVERSADQIATINAIKAALRDAGEPDDDPCGSIEALSQARREALESAACDVAQAHEDHDRIAAELESTRANVATLVEQLGEAERRVAELRGLIVRMADQTRSDVNALEASDDTGHRRSVAERARYDLRRVVEQVASAGAAQPVVEPRDETKPPPGWRVYEVNGGTPEAYWEVARADDDAGSTDWEHKSMALHDAWEWYDREHGYAPHPSGTADEKLLASYKQAISNLDNIESVLRGLDRCRVPDEPSEYGRALMEWLARSDTRHPSGTEGPLREALSSIDRRYVQRVVDSSQNESYPQVSRGVLVALLRAIDAALAASPPDGTAPERAPRLDVNAKAFVAAAIRGTPLSPHEREQALLWLDATADATRPPDGMPGEPAAVKSDKELLREMYPMPKQEPMTAEESAAFVAAVTAPPTVPGGPAVVHGNAPRCQKCGTANYVIRKRCRNCNEDLVQHPDPAIDAEVRWDAEDGLRAEESARAAAPPTVPGGPPQWFVDAYTKATAAPPTPPLTPERAPLDEAAVRADERAKTERDIFEHVRETLNVKCVDIIDSRYPRRSEGAGQS